MSMKAGKAIQEATNKTVETVSEGTKNLRNSQAGATTSTAVQNMSRNAAEGGSYLYNVTKSTTQGLAARLAGSGLPALCAKEAKCAPLRLCCRSLPPRENGCGSAARAARLVRHTGVAPGRSLKSVCTNMHARWSPEPRTHACDSAPHACRDAPCPRIVLVCCTAICAGGLASEGLFTTTADSAETADAYATLSASSCTHLLPPSATPQLVSAVLKKWLTELRPEPLLTFKLVPAMTSPDTPKEASAAILDELPPPNRAALLMILETAHRVASNAAINDTDAATLAAALSPCLLWREADPAATAAQPADDPALRLAGEPLPQDDEAVFVKLLTHMIANYRTLL